MSCGSSRTSSPRRRRALLFVGTLSGREEVFRRSVERLGALFGPVLRETPPRPWHSTHYTDELGPRIMRRFVFFENLVSQDQLRDLKLETVGIEDGFRENGRRRINLDPGYLTLAKVVLASTKDYAHRIYLGRGIFAELTLYYRDGRFNPHLFTYPDFREEETLAMFQEMREVFRERVEG